MATPKSTVIPFNKNKVASYNAEVERENNIIGIRIEEARRRRGLSQREFCNLLKGYGVSVGPTAISKWTSQGAVPNAYQLIAICRALEIDDGLAYFTKDYVPALNEAGMRKVAAYREDLIASGNYKPQPKMADEVRYIYMPVSTLRVSAGTGAFLDEGNFEEVRFRESAVPYGADFGVRISGDSMETTYHDGQIVWIQKCETILPGQVGVFVYEGEGFLKEYSEQEPADGDVELFTDSYGIVHMQPVLVSHNDNYDPIVIRPESAFQVVGRAL